MPPEIVPASRGPVRGYFASRAEQSCLEFRRLSPRSLRHSLTNESTLPLVRLASGLFGLIMKPLAPGGLLLRSDSVCPGQSIMWLCPSQPAPRKVPAARKSSSCWRAESCCSLAFFCHSLLSICHFLTDRKSTRLNSSHLVI